MKKMMTVLLGLSLSLGMVVADDKHKDDKHKDEKHEKKDHKNDKKH